MVIYKETILVIILVTALLAWAGYKMMQKRSMEQQKLEQSRLEQFKLEQIEKTREPRTVAEYLAKYY